MLDRFSEFLRKDTSTESGNTNINKSNYEKLKYFNKNKQIALILLLLCEVLLLGNSKLTSD